MGDLECSCLRVFHLKEVHLLFVVVVGTVTSKPYGFAEVKSAYGKEILRINIYPLNMKLKLLIHSSSTLLTTVGLNSKKNIYN